MTTETYAPPTGLTARIVRGGIMLAWDGRCDHPDFNGDILLRRALDGEWFPLHGGGSFSGVFLDGNVLDGHHEYTYVIERYFYKIERGIFRGESLRSPEIAITYAPMGEVRQRDNRSFLLSTGRLIVAPGGVLAVNRGGSIVRITEGSTLEALDDRDLTPTERAEIADEMIRRWQAWASV